MNFKIEATITFLEAYLPSYLFYTPMETKI